MIGGKPIHEIHSQVNRANQKTGVTGNIFLLSVILLVVDIRQKRKWIWRRAGADTNAIVTFRADR